MAEEGRAGFQRAHDNGERLYKLQEEQSRRMLNMLEDHGKTLGGLVTSVAVIEEQTKDFPTLKDRVRKLEEFKWKTVGIIGAAAGLGWLLENHVKIAEIFSK